MTLGEKLRYIRELRQMTITEVAKLAGISPSYISYLELGSRRYPSIKTLEKLAKALRVPKEYFLEEKTYLPSEIINDLPLDVKEWLLKEDAMPYIRIAMDLYKTKVPPDKAKKFIDFFRQFMDGNK